MDKEPHVVVIGASNLDIKGKSFKTVVPYTSNPGQVEISAGGVGRNIAENLARLGINTTLISAVANDPFSDFLINETRNAGVDMDHVINVEDISSSLFLAVLNHRGDLMSAISDMAILNSITPDKLKERETVIRTADYIIVDADIPADSMDFILNISKETGIPVCVEPVSVDKARNLLPFLDRISIVTPNREEAEALGCMEIKGGAKGVIAVGDAILEKGVKSVIITLGAEGIYFASQETKRFISSISTVVEDSVGAGDSLVAGTVFGLCRGNSMYDAIRMGIAVATLTLTTKKAVHPALTPEILEDIMARGMTPE
ncbi:MAG: carbohydrate kinase family protein [Firmicutes bacterium]|nr:carbohydrate kinase family protein [Bacillota bacterium]